MLEVIAALALGGASPVGGEMALTLRAGSDQFIDLDQRGNLKSSGEVRASEEEHPRSKRWIPFAAAGGVLLAGGVGSYVVARQTEYQLLAGDPSFATKTDVDAAVRRGKLFERVGLAGMGVGLVGVGLGAAFFFMDAPKAAPAVVLVPSLDGGTVVFSGVFR